MTDSDSQNIKRRKKTKPKSSCNNHLQCELFLTKKNRRCAMQRKANQKYCSEHMIHDKNLTENTRGERVPCPLDPKHSVWSKDLKSHTKKCNLKPKQIHDPWFESKFNAAVKGTENSVLEQEADVKSEKELFGKYIPIIEELGNTFEPLTLRKTEHKGLDSRLAELSNKKHAAQQSSLIGNLRDNELLGINNFYVEFGCGKGELSRTLNLCILSDEKDAKNTHQYEYLKYGFGFIDRGVNRMKMDSKIVKDCEESQLSIMPIMRRSKIDIQDLNLDKFLLDLNPDKIIGISKHLCGAATDLTLTLILNSTLLNGENSKFGGLLIAMCCRHVCDFDVLLPQSRAFLYEKGFKSKESFKILKKVVSWAVCGTRDKNNDISDHQHISGLSYESREKLGFVARRIIDESRKYAMNEILNENGFVAEIFLYTDTDTTLENSCLCIKPRK